MWRPQQGSGFPGSRFIYDLYQLVRPVTMINDSQILLGRHWCKWKYFLSHRCRHQETLVEVSCGVCVNMWITTTSASFKLCWPRFLMASLGLRSCFSDIWDEIANYIPFRSLQRYSNFKKCFQAIEKDSDRKTESDTQREGVGVKGSFCSQSLAQCHTQVQFGHK